MEELISTVNEEDKEIAVKSRKEAHEKLLLHRECGLFIRNEKKRAFGAGKSR